MATASAAKSKAVATKQTDAAQPEAAEVAVSLPSRREFLYYIWGASLAMLVGEVVAATLWFAYPRFAEGEFGGTFAIDPTELPPPGGAPVSKPEGRFWLSSPVVDGEETFLALYGVCTHLGCLPKWVDVASRFECPCHGSKFERDGLYIAGPAPRSMDRFQTTIIFTDGTTAESNATGDPIPLNGRQIASVRVNTGSRILRSGKV